MLTYLSVWLAVNPRFLTKTTITNNGSVYLFDGVYLLSHGEPPSVPQVQQHVCITTVNCITLSCDCV